MVKALNSVGPAALMADPVSLAVPPSTFLCGDDADAKKTVAGLLVDLRWAPQRIIDLGGVANACLEGHFQDGVCLFGAGSGVGLQPVELLVFLGQVGAGWFLDR